MPNRFFMKKYCIASIVLSICCAISAQNINDLKFGTDSTLEVVTWNIHNYPQNGQITADYVRQIIKSLDADVISFQELTDTILFKQMLAGLPDYQYSFKSSWYDGLAYIYKKKSIQINAIYDIYTTSEYWTPFPRSPLVMDMNYKGQRYYIINNHLKCCGDGTLELGKTSDEETRRYNASNLLKNYIDNYLSNRRVLMLGDLNDDIAEPRPNNVFDGFITDSLNYQFTDMKIAKGGINQWSYPSWPSHLDHILITNEVFAAFQHKSSEIKTINIEHYMAGGLQEYYTYISDHRPVAVKLLPAINTSVYTTDQSSKISFYISQNPFQYQTRFLFDEIQEESNIEIFNTYGQKINTIYLSKGQSEGVWSAENHQNGIYFAKLISGSKTIADTKIVLLR